MVPFLLGFLFAFLFVEKITIKMIGYHRVGELSGGWMVLNLLEFGFGVLLGLDLDIDFGGERSFEDATVFGMIVDIGVETISTNGKPDVEVHILHHGVKSSFDR